MPAEAAELLLLAAQVPLHLVERLGGVHHRIAAVVLHPLDVLEEREQLGVVEVHQAAVAEAEVAGGEVRERVAEGAALEAERAEEVGQLLVVLDEPAGRDARGALDADSLEELVRLLDFPAHVGEAAVGLVLGDVVGVDGHDDAGEAIAGERLHVVVVPQAAVGANHRVDALLRRVADHRTEVAVRHRFATDEEQVADVVALRDVHHVLRLLKRDAVALLGVEL